jgi:hypothetical protein
VTQSRRKPFLFSVIGKDGRRRRDALFYALTLPEALRCARAWCARMGHREVVLVHDEERVA